MATETTPGHEQGAGPGAETSAATDTDPNRSAGPDAASLTTTARFLAFHQANPGIYRELVQLCREFAHATGRRRFGIRQPWERLRWNLAVRTSRPEGDPKLNDLYLPFFARLIAHREPDLAGLFETRRAVEADAWAETLPAQRTPAADKHTDGGDRP